MVLVAEKQHEIDYEPTVQDRILKILNMLDNNAVVLAPYYLKKGDKFCVLGLFADQYPGGEWILERDPSSVYMFKDDKGEKQAGCLTEAVANYYGFRNSAAAFNIDELPAYLQVLLRDFTCKGRMSLSTLNDLLVFKDSKFMHRILADVIRSGALFDRQAVNTNN